MGLVGGVGGGGGTIAAIGLSMQLLYMDFGAMIFFPWHNNNNNEGEGKEERNYVVDTQMAKGSS